MITYKEFLLKEGTIVPDERALSFVISVLNDAKEDMEQGMNFKTALTRINNSLKYVGMGVMKLPVQKHGTVNAITNTSTGAIILDVSTVEDYIKSDSPNKEQRLRAVLGHEMVHREQDKRKKLNQRYVPKQREYKDYAQYKNDRDELNAWAYEFANYILSLAKERKFNKNQTLTLAFNNLNHSAVKKEMENLTKYLTPENKKKAYKYVYDIVSSTFDKQIGTKI
jgi:hypothetical protein